MQTMSTEHVESTGPRETHEMLSATMMQLVEKERASIACLDLDGMAESTEERIALAERVIRLAKIEPIPDHAALIYRRVQEMAEENYELLQTATGAVRGMIERIATEPVPTYAPNASVAHAASSAFGALTWQG